MTDPARTTSAAGAPTKETLKQSAIGLIISFVLVLAFRGFVFEPFHIPTGSMAPTLMGQHMRLRSPHSGFDWAVNPWAQQIPGTRSIQFGAPDRLTLDEEPLTQLPYVETNPALRAGDRIGILKYNPLYQPRRFDVVVVKWPASPRENYIKRLVGMPGEELWLIDGDAFVRDAANPDDPWRILRKPARVQETLWWPLYSGEFAPLDRTHNGREWQGPWAVERGDMTKTADGFVSTTRTHNSIVWDTERWPITDWQPYNDYRQDDREMSEFIPRFPISDVRLRAAVGARTQNTRVFFEIEARGEHFMAAIEPGLMRLFMYREQPGSSPPVVMQEFARTTDAVLPVGGFADVALCHVDQSVQLWIDGTLVLEGEYDWDPETRLRRSTTLSGEQITRLFTERATDGQIYGNTLADPAIYRAPRARIIVQDSDEVEFRRIGLDRDVYYQPREYPPGTRLAGRAALGTHPGATARMGPDEFFLLGDNSANSADSRLVDLVDPWVRSDIDSSLGLIHRRMMTGRAVIVFWPSAHPLRLGASRFSFIPDFGRMRFIW